MAALTHHGHYSTIVLTNAVHEFFCIKNPTIDIVLANTVLQRIDTVYGCSEVLMYMVYAVVCVVMTAVM